MSSIDQLTARLRIAYHQLDDAMVVEIEPQKLAEAVMSDIDPAKAAPAMVAWGCMEHLKQLARAVCRAIDPAELGESSEQGEMFAGTLYDRYPAKRNGQYVRVLRDHLTLPERLAIEHQFEKQISARLAHLEMFRAETQLLVASGLLDKAA